MKLITLLISIIIMTHVKGQAQIETGDLKLYHGTSIIAFLKDDIGWIAADSKVVEETNGVTKGYKTVRKIHQTNSIFYGFTVHPVMYFDNELIYDAFSLMDSIIKQEKDFNKSYAAFDKAIRRKLDEAITILQNNGHFGTLEKYTKTSFLGFLVVQYKNGKPDYQMRTYRFQKSLSGYQTILEPPMVMQGLHPILFLGSFDAAVKYIMSHRQMFVGFKDIREKLICLIAEEINANPNYVGFPVDAVEITHGGYKWYYDNMKCTQKE